MFLLNSRIPLVRFSSELIVNYSRKADEDVPNIPAFAIKEPLRCLRSSKMAKLS
jgi:hypothetical protein